MISIEGGSDTHLEAGIGIDLLDFTTMDDPREPERGPENTSMPAERAQERIGRPTPDQLLQAIERLLGSDRRHAERFIRYAKETRMSLEHVWCSFGEDDSILATALASPSPGGTAMLFASSPHSSEEATAIGRIIEATCSSLTTSGTALAQALVEPGDILEQEAFVHGGLRRLATLTYMERPVPKRNTIPAPELPDGISLKRFRNDDRPVLERLLIETYRDTLDCPGLAGLRSPSDVVDGHIHSGIFRPQWWFIAHDRGTPCGVVLLNGSAGSSSIELVYLGIISTARGRGIGPALLQHGLHVVAGSRERTIVLAVDEANAPALAMYEKACFQRTIRRVALIRSLNPPAGGAT